MECERCGTEMKIGQAIDPQTRERWCCTGFGGFPVSTHETISVIECYKCPKCGDSDYIDRRSPYEVYARFKL